MLSSISQKITQNFLSKGIIEEKLFAVYQYGTELMLSCIFTSTCILILSCIIDSFFAGFLYLAIFMPLKATTGGYHASTYSGCFFISCLAYVIQTIIGKILFFFRIPNLFWVVLLFLTTIYIFHKAPIKNENHPVGAKVLNKNKHQARILLCSECLIITGLYILLKQSYLLNHVVLTIVSIALFIYTSIRKGGNLSWES